MATGVNIVVVGLDGSPDALAAVGWAAALVGPSGTVHTVHALEHEPAAGRSGAPVGEADLAVWSAVASGSGTTLVPHVVDGPCVDALIGTAREVGAQMVVVGGHGRSPRRPRMIGTVTHRLLHDSDFPVAVVRHGRLPAATATDTATDIAGSTVVVGIGDGHATKAAVNWAVTFAGSRHMALELVHAIEHQTLHLLYTPVFSMDQAMEKAARYFDPEALRRWADDDLAELVQRLHSQHGIDTLPIGHAVVEGAPGPVLVQAGRHAALLVLGKHFDGALTGYFTTATLHHVLTHAPCPVVVVPQEHGQD